MDQLYCNKIILFFLEINRLQMQATSNYITLFGTSSAHQIFLFYDCTWYIIQINAVKIINAFDSQMTTSHKIETFHFTCILWKNYKFHKHKTKNVTRLLPFHSVAQFKILMITTMINLFDCNSKRIYEIYGVQGNTINCGTPYCDFYCSS